MRWEAKAAKREVAEAALRKAIEHIESSRSIGGSSSSPSVWYIRALYLVREAERALRLSEGGA